MSLYYMSSDPRHDERKLQPFRQDTSSPVGKDAAQNGSAYPLGGNIRHVVVILCRYHSGDPKIDDN